MYRCEECYDGLSCTDISLKESRHRIRLFHILQYLEEDYLLLIRKGEWKISDERLHELSIEWSRWSESLTLTSRGMLLLYAHELESKKLSISEFPLCPIE